MTLQHMDVEPLKEVDSQNDTPLYQRASELLGYERLTLLSTLLSIGVTPFETESVEEYKTKQAKRNLRRDLDSHSKWILSVLTSSTVLACLFGWMIFAATSTLQISIIGVLIFACVASAGYCSYLIRLDGLRLKSAYWVKGPLRDNSGDIPPMVLDLATRIAEAAPEAKLEVETLQHTTDIILDPFLVVSMDGASCYVAVWDEPGFDKRPMDIS